MYFFKGLSVFYSSYKQSRKLAKLKGVFELPPPPPHTVQLGISFSLRIISFTFGVQGLLHLQKNYVIYIFIWGGTSTPSPDGKI